MIQKFEEVIVCFLLLFLSIYLEYSTKVGKILNEDFENPQFLTGLFMAIIFLVYVISKNHSDKEKKTKIIESVKKSLMALVIAYLAHLDLIYTPFWLVFILSFFFHDWV